MQAFKQGLGVFSLLLCFRRQLIHGEDSCPDKEGAEKAICLPDYGLIQVLSLWAKATSHTLVSWLKYMNNLSEILGHIKKAG